MTRRSPLHSTRRHVHIFDDDWEFLIDHYGRASAKPITASAAVRTMVHLFVKRLKAKAEEEMGLSPAELQAFAELEGAEA